MSTRTFYRTIISEEKVFPSRLKTFFYSLMRIVLRISDNFFHDSCLIRASGLAFNSLLALVPLSAVLFAFGGFNSVGGELYNYLVEVLLPSSLNQVLDALSGFTENSAKLGTYGLVFFLITILFLMNNIENNLNAIWHCKRKRKFFQQFTIYTTVIVFTSLLVGGNFSISGDLLAILPDYTGALNKPFIVKTLYRVSSILFITTTFLLLIMLIPSTRVSFLSALTGALAGAVIWELAKWGFKTWASYSVRNSVIYGSLFLIPLLLIWLYVVWLIIMIAMETAYVHQHRKEKHIRYQSEKMTWEVFNLKLDLYLAIARFYLDGTAGADDSKLSEALGINEEETREGIAVLINENLVARTENGTYLPVRPPEKMKLSDLYYKLSGIDENPSAALSDFKRGGDRELNNKTVSDLFDGIRREDSV
ncbi:YihY/virulence factor BrkB family protein [Spirochaeta isovalerica]|uniref:Membrane protein n=1 Tax=Spirochaeta isovalerica TaxID=150 RepID=A0A841RA94_9SPIO|nr:YhjD/YihY/BrkB family envelope integrity protein [Spirochaeta isovalerica]MBB6480823.1 membrane protein [Spirochaeta isovalerica]